MVSRRNLKNFFRQISPNAIDYLQRLLGKRDKTYAGEFSQLKEILIQLGSPKEFKFVDIGAGDGFNMSVAWPLSRQFNATGLLIEPNQFQLNKARNLYKKRQTFSYSSDFLTPVNVFQVISDFGFTDAFYVKIDIDSYDLAIMRSLVLGGIKPKILSIEINELFPPPIRFEMKYIKNQPMSTAPLFGCSLQSVYEFASRNGYFLHSLAFNNAFFVLEDCLDSHTDFRPLSPNEAYEEGFLNREWRDLFPWDVKFEDWLTKSPLELLQVLRGSPDFDESVFLLSED